MIANWKMLGFQSHLAGLTRIEEAAGQARCIDVVVCPPALLLSSARAVAPSLALGGQDCHDTASAAFTGGASPMLLKDMGADLVIVGHSERRHGIPETDELVRRKAAAAIEHGLTAVICVGETAEERQSGAARDRVGAQVAASVPRQANASKLVLAYEPIWAIGSGRRPSSSSIADIIGIIRSSLHNLDPTLSTARILYGGSVNAANAAAILADGGADGLLVGSAGLSPETFIPLIHAAKDVAACGNLDRSAICE